MYRYYCSKCNTEIMRLRKRRTCPTCGAIIQMTSTQIKYHHSEGWGLTIFGIFWSVVGYSVFSSGGKEKGAGLFLGIIGIILVINGILKIMRFRK